MAPVHFTVQDAIAIRQSTAPAADLAAQYDVDIAVIRQIKNEERFANVEVPPVG